MGEGWHRISQVGVEAVASVDETPDFVVGEAVFVELGRGVFEDGTAVLGHAETDVVLQMRLECFLRDLFVYEVLRLFLEDTCHHGEGVSLGVVHANFVQFSSVFVLGVTLHSLTVGGSGKGVRVVGEWLFPGGSLGPTRKRFF